MTLTRASSQSPKRARSAAETAPKSADREEARSPALRIESAGNLALARLLGSGRKAPRVQPQLAVGSAGEADELAAEAFASTVSGAPVASPGDADARDAVSTARGDATEGAERAIAGSGEPLDAGVRGELERASGADLSHVAVHRDEEASRAAGRMGALAYTVGNDIAFGARQYRPHSPQGRRLIAHEIAHTLQQSRHRRLAPMLQLWRWPWETPPTGAALIAEAAAGDTDAIGEITDFTSVGEAQRLTMIDALTHQFWVGGNDEAALVRIWNSFGAEFFRVAGANALRWRYSTSRHSGLWDAVPEALRVRDAFVSDVRAAALANLQTNRTYAEEQMTTLGLPRTAEAQAEPLTADPSGQIARLQVAAEGVAQLQRAQEIAREAFVGYQEVLSDSFNDTPAYRRVRFSPDAPPPLTELPGSGYDLWDDQHEQFEYIGGFGLPRPHGGYVGEAEEFLASLEMLREMTALVPYATLKEHYDQATAAIAATLTAFPQLYAITIEGTSAATARLATAGTPEQARRVLAEAFRTLLSNIANTEQLLTAGELDPLDLTPLHQRLYASPQAGASGVQWSEPFSRSVGELLTLDHNIDVALRRLLFQSIAQLAFVFAPLAGPLAIPLLLVGTVSTGANLVLSAERYQALSAAAGSGALPATQLVTPGAVDEARMATEADAIALAIAVVALGVTAGGAALRGIRAVQQTRLTAQRARILQRVGPSAEVLTTRGNEIPYGIPKGEIQIVEPGRPLDFRRLDPSRRYLWNVDEPGAFRVADEGQGARFPQRRPLETPHPAAGETPLKHGDLTPASAGQARGPARIGGELHAEMGPNGQPTGRWLMDRNSSHTYARADAVVPTAQNLQAVRDLLATTGTDVSRLVIVP